MLLPLLGVASPAYGANVGVVPKPDHIVIVVEENRASSNILGNPNAPYINSLAASGANMTQFFAETHPSEPNYLALFSGGTQGVTDDSCPHTFSGDNLGSELLQTGQTFAGYSESLPSVGFTGCTSGKYARKHNPWSDFSNVPASANRPFSAFPTDFSQLPAVSFVIPNLDDDMHDGTIAQGDTWLQNNLGAYVSWAQSHNSVLALTFDEDDSGHGNQIPTILTGQRIQPGSYSEQVNHYNLLRTVEDAYSLTPVGASATASPLLDIWSAPGGDQPPVAAFSVSCSGLMCSFDGSGSSDPDGSVVSYSWAFGDGGSGSGVSASHTYASGGAQSVTLTVTDDQGVSSSVTHTATPSAGAAVLASDAFGRSVSSGWGTADQGGVWSASASANALSVGGGVGQMKLASPSAGPLVWLGGISASDVNMLVDVSVDKISTGDGVRAILMARRSGTSSYRLKLRLMPAGAVRLAWSRVVSGTETSLGDIPIAGLSYAPGDVLRVRFVVQTQGASTAISGSVWKAGSGEPGSPQLSGTDSTAALQVPGSVAIQSSLAANATNAPITVSYDNFSLTDASAQAHPAFARRLSLA